MTDTPKKMPKGGRKGGTTFPRLSLGDALKYAEKLVSKTHTGPQPEAVILKGVFGNSGSVGRIRVSALKQFGLLKYVENGLCASDLARDVIAAPDEEKRPLLTKACLTPNVFRTLFDTFHSDQVTKAKIRQQTSSLNVHPDLLEPCVDLFLQSLQTASLATVLDDKVSIVSASSVTESIERESIDTEDSFESEDIEPSDVDQPDSQGEDGSGQADNESHANRPRAIIQVNVTLDSSLDTDKLEEQLKLLRQYGAI